MRQPLECMNLECGSQTFRETLELFQVFVNPSNFKFGLSPMAVPKSVEEGHSVPVFKCPSARSLLNGSVTCIVKLGYTEG